MPASRSKSTGWGWDQTGPVWGARAFAPKSGQDHLGLGSVSSDRILPTLSPGINVLTVHPRYWSFYAWVLDEFWARDLPRTSRAFIDFYRPREALFAMACHVCEEHGTLMANVVGSRRIGPLADEATFDPTFDYIKEPLGGYGLYYRSAMEQTGTVVVARPSNGFPFDAPTPSGRALADAFRRAIAGTRLATTLSGELEKPVPREDLVDFARSACLCQLQVAADYDLPLLQDLFLHSGGVDEEASRSQTLRFVLDLSHCVQEWPIHQDTFRQLIYFRSFDSPEYTPRPELVNVARRWRVYQGREYFAFVFNRLLRWVTRRGLDETESGLTPMAMEDLWGLVAGAINESPSNPDMNLSLPLVSADTAAHDLLEGITGTFDVTGSADVVWPRDDTGDEHALYEACRYIDVDDGATLIALLAMLLLLRERFGLPERAAAFTNEQVFLAEGGSLRNGMSRFMHLLNQQMLRNPTVAELLRWLIEDFVIVQHERVAAAKLPDDTYRLRRVGNSIRFFPQDVPTQFNDSRFGALSTMVHDLGWVTKLGLPKRKLTVSGRTLLANGDLPAGALATARAPFEVDKSAIS